MCGTLFNLYSLVPEGKESALKMTKSQWPLPVKPFLSISDLSQWKMDQALPAIVSDFGNTVNFLLTLLSSLE